MKKLTFTLFLLIPFLASAQNFTNICSQGPAFYKKLNTNSLKAFKYTAFAIPAPGDTIFYTFPTVRDTGATCLDTTKGSILGKKIYRQSSSYMFYFFNKFNDTIYINAKAQVNDTWRFVKLTLGTFLEAKAVSIGPDTVMGVLDDVMLIELQAKRSDGMPIANPWNGKFLKLSKRYGLARTFDFNNLPYDTTNYTLVGKLKPAIGVQEFGWRDVYNYSIGDVFHFSGYTNSTSGPSSTWKEIQNVYAKTFYGTNNDSVVYKIDRCRSTLANPGGHTYFRDTLTIKYRFNVLANDSSMMRYPDEFDRQNIYASQFDRFQKAFNNRQTKKITDDKYRFLNSCWTLPTGSVNLYRNYSEGLGITEYYRDDQSTQDFYKLVYFKKGAESWGSMISTECSPMLDVDDSPVAKNLQARILPNPVKDKAVIMIDLPLGQSRAHFRLLSLVGKTVYETAINASTAEFDRGNLPAGLYLYTITAGPTTITGKVILD